MPGIGRVGVDTAGGVILGPGAPTVLTNGVPTCCVGDAIAPHGEPPHDSATMVTGSATVLAEGKPVCRAGDLASCGHVLGPGSLNTFAG